jgi:hypothetical protein
MGRARLGQKLREPFHFFRLAEQMLRGRGRTIGHTADTSQFFIKSHK